MTIKPNNFKRGKGTWKFNCSLLKNNNYIELVNHTILEQIEQYATPVYNSDALGLIPGNEIQFTITDTLFLETLLLAIRTKTLPFTSKLNRDKLEQEKKLMQDINTIESDLNLSQLTELLEDKKSELQEIHNHRLKGHMIRSRTQWLDEGERPTKYFCGLETKKLCK